MTKMKEPEDQNRRLKKMHADAQMWARLPKRDFALSYLRLRSVKVSGWNHKRIYWIYWELELNL